MSKDLTLIPTADELTVYQVMAKTAGKSQLYNKIGGEEGLLSIMLMARELGIPPMQALTSMSVIQGKVEVSPRLMNMMIRKAGHRLDIETSDTTCSIKGTRNDTQEHYTATYTIEEARKAGLVKSGGGWEKYPSDMLFARCLSRLARRLFADVISSSYIEGEICGDSSGGSEPTGNSVQLPKPEKAKEAEPLVEAEIVKEPEMTIEEFVTYLKEKSEVNYTFSKMNEYLSKLESEKGVPIPKIMEQALRAPLLPRFCKGWSVWYEAQD